MPDYPFPADPDEVLLTERLRLEPVRAELAPLLFDLWQDPDIYRYVPEDPPVSVDWLTERYRRLETRQSADGGEAWLQWAVRLAAEPTYVGRVEATVRPGRAFLAWMLGASWWRLGLGTEAVTRVLTHLAGPWAVADAYAEVDERNTASLGLAARLGFVEVERVEDADFFKGTTSHERHLHRSLAGLAPSVGPGARAAGYGG